MRGLTATVQEGDENGEFADVLAGPVRVVVYESLVQTGTVVVEIDTDPSHGEPGGFLTVVVNGHYLT